jgi:hypothetical protein
VIRPDAKNQRGELGALQLLEVIVAKKPRYSNTFPFSLLLWARPSSAFLVLHSCGAPLPMVA